MWEQLILPLIGTILGTGSIAAFLNYRISKNKEPIDAATAAAAISEKAGNMALAIAERQDKDIRRQTDDILGLRKSQTTQGEVMDAMAKELAMTKSKLTEKSQKLDRLDQRFETFFHGIRDWYDNKIVAQWDDIRQRPVPPDPPMEMANTNEYTSILDM